MATPSWDALNAGLPDPEVKDPGSAVKTIDGKPLQSPLRNVDADTLASERERYRLQGFNAPETLKVKGGVIIPGQVEADNTQAVANTVAKMAGYTDLVPTGSKDVHGRTLAKQVNPAGDSLGDTLVALGVTNINPYTSLDAVGRKSFLDALHGLMPELANSDPTVRFAREQYEKRVKAAGGDPLFVPRAYAHDETQFAAIKNMVGTQALGKALEEIDRLENILKDPNLDANDRKRVEGLLEKARDQAYLSSALPDYVGSVIHRHGDRNIMNQAYDQWGTSWESAVLDMKNKGWGILEQAGDAAKWEWLANAGREGVARAKMDAGALPDTLSDWKDIEGTNSWETIKNSATYASNMLAGSLPMMGVLLASGALAPAGALGFAAATVPGALLYSGGFYADQPSDKKNSSLAIGAGIASAVLEKVGIEGMFGHSIFDAVSRKAVIEAMTRPGMRWAGDAAAAEAFLKEASRKTIIEMVEGGAQFAKNHYATRQAHIAALKQITLSGAIEAGTESGQQILELFAQAGEFDPSMRYEKEFYSAVSNAAIGGGILGGSFHAIGTAIDMGRWHSAGSAKQDFERQMTERQLWGAQRRERQAAGTANPNTLEGARNTIEAIAMLNQMSFPEGADNLNNMAGKPGMWNGFLSIVKDPLSFYRGLSDTIVRKYRKDDGSFKQYMPILQSLLRPGLLAGDHYDGFQQRIIGAMATPDLDALADELRVPTRQVHSLLRDAWQQHWSRNQDLPPDTAQNVTLQRWKEKAENAVQIGRDLLASVGYDTSNISPLNAAFVDASVDPRQIAANQGRLSAYLVNSGMNSRQAANTIEDLMSGEPVRMAAAKERLVESGAFADPSLNDLFEPNIVDAFENFKHKLAGQAAKEIFFGRNGSNLAKLLHLAAQNREFSSEEEFLTTVQNVKDAYAIAEGTYNSLKAYPNIEKMVGWGVTATMLASLGKAAFSSIPEIAMSTLGTPGDKVSSQLAEAAKTLIEEIRSDLNKATSFSVSAIGLGYARNSSQARAVRAAEEVNHQMEQLMNNPNSTQEEHDALAARVKEIHKKYLKRSLFERLGYNDSGYNSQARFETDTANMKNTMRVFSSIILLRAMTDATRMGALSVAADILHTKLHSLMSIPLERRNAAVNRAEGITKEQAYSIKELQGWGIDVEKMLTMLDVLQATDERQLGDIIDAALSGTNTDRNPAMLHILRDPAARQALGNIPDIDQFTQNVVRELEADLLRATRNMVNEKVVHPSMANLPKYYYDPRLRVLTTMTRFVAAMTSTILPRLYRDYMIQGHAGMRYQAFITMAMALFFAHMANAMKDLLAYGDDESPYIKSNVKKAQRDLYGAGLLGRVESLVDTVSPLYDTKKADPSKEPLKYTYQSIKNAAPPISWADKAVSAFYNIGTGDTQKGVKQAVRAAPVIGSFPVAAEVISQQFKKD